MGRAHRAPKRRPHDSGLYAALANAYLAAAEQIVSQSLQDPELGQKALPSFNKAFEQLEGDMEALSGLIEENANQSSVETNATISAANRAIIVVLLISLLLLTAQGIWIVSSIMRPLRFANRIATATAAGNLSEYIEQPSSQDEASTLVRSLASMQRDLREMIELITLRLVRQSIRQGRSTQAGKAGHG